jgi:hypothetical protein
MHGQQHVRHVRFAWHCVLDVIPACLWGKHRCDIVAVMRSRRGLPFTLRRMGMHRPVLAAAALLTLITAALIATLAAFAGQALSQAVQRKLAAAPGTSVVISGSAQPARAAAATAAIRSTLGSDLGAKGYTLTRGTWSDPLRLPARYDSANVPLAQAAALQGVAGHAVLLSGPWSTRCWTGRAGSSCRAR